MGGRRVVWLLASAALGASARAETLTVLGAASLRESFTELARRFEASHPGVHVRLSFGGSQNLVASILLGAPCDVFASADAAQMRRAVSGGKARAREVHPLCGNRLVIVVRPGGPRVRGLADLAQPGLRLDLAKPAVPAGEYADKALEAARARLGTATLARILANVRSREEDVRVVLTRVQLGEADAGFVYATDAAAGKLPFVELPAGPGVAATYSIAPLLGSGDRATAKAFVAFALGRAGQAELRAHGFVPRGRLRRK